MRQTHSEPEFAEEYSRAERVRLAVILALIGAAAVLSANAWLFPWIRELAASAPCRTVFGLDGLTFLSYFVFVGVPLHAAALVGAIFGWRGYKTLRDGQFPPAKEKVLRPTRIRRGDAARRIGYLHLFAFVPFIALATWGNFQAREIAGAARANTYVCAEETSVQP